MATDLIPNSEHARKTRIAISPLFATKTERMGLYSTYNINKNDFLNG